MAKEFGTSWVFESFEEQPSFFTKRMFGGLAVYLHGRMVMVLTETEGERFWKGREYDFDIWNGILLPTEREQHESLIGEFPSLVSHPVLGKWLYLPISDLEFEASAQSIADCIGKNDRRFGIYGKSNKKVSAARKKITNKKKAKKKKLRSKQGKKLKKKTRRR